MLDRLRDWWGNIVNVTTTLANTPAIGSNGVMYDTDPSELKPILAPTKRQEATQRAIIKSRRFHAGIVTGAIHDLLRATFPHNCDDVAAALNFIPRISKARSERLKPERFECETDNQAEKEKQENWANNVVWDTSRLKGKRAALFYQAMRDGQAFLLVDPDPIGKRARITPHIHYTDKRLITGDTTDDDGEGAVLVYPNDDPDQRPLYGYKRWTEYATVDGKPEAMERITVYRDNIIRKWGKKRTGWTEIEQPVIWTVDGSVTGDPLGIPIIHIKTPLLAPVAEPAYGVQLILDSTYADMTVGSRIDLLRIFITYGWEWPDEPINPGTVTGTAQSTDATTQVVEGSDATRYIDMLKAHVSFMCDLTNTPLTLVQRSAQRAAEGTLQEEKESFFSEIGDIADTFAMALEDAFKKARMIANVFFNENLNEEPAVRVVWKPFGGNKTTAEKQMDAALILSMQQAAQGFIDANAPREAAYLAAGFDADMAKQLSATWIDNSGGVAGG
jgi:hypothetical protein